MRPTGTLAWVLRVFGPWLMIAGVFVAAVLAYAVLDAIPAIVGVVRVGMTALALVTVSAGVWAIADAIAKRRVRP